MATGFVPHEIDYSSLPIGSKIRNPKGVITKCPKCGANALELLFSQRKGRYEASYWHVGYKDVVGAPTLARKICRIICTTKKEFDKMRFK